MSRVVRYTEDMFRNVKHPQKARFWFEEASRSDSEEAETMLEALKPE